MSSSDSRPPPVIAPIAQSERLVSELLARYRASEPSKQLELAKLLWHVFARTKATAYKDKESKAQKQSGNGSNSAPATSGPTSDSHSNTQSEKTKDPADGLWFPEDDHCRQWVESEFFGVRAVVKPDRIDLENMNAGIEVPIKSKSRKNRDAPKGPGETVTSLCALARRFEYELCLGIGRLNAASAYHLQSRLTSMLQLPPLSYEPDAPTEEWQPRLVASDFEAHKREACKAFRRVMHLIAEEAEKRREGLSKQLSWVCFFENSASLTLELLDSDGLDFPQAMHGVHTPQRLPRGLQRRDAALEFIELDTKSGMGTFAMREYVDVAWTLRYNSPQLRLLLFINWCDLDGISTAESDAAADGTTPSVADVAPIKEILRSLHSDLKPSIRMLGGWLAQSCIRLDHTDPPLFASASDLLRDLGNVFRSSRESEQRADKLNDVLKRHAFGDVEGVWSCVNWVIPSVDLDPEPLPGTEWYDRLSGVLKYVTSENKVATRPVQVVQEADLGKEKHVLRFDESMVLQLAKSAASAPSPGARYLASISSGDDRTVKKTLAAQAAYFGTPLLYEPNEFTPRRRSRRPLSDVRAKGRPAGPMENAFNDTSGTEIAVPIPSYDSEHRTPIGVFLAQHDSPKSLNVQHVRRMDAIARLYAALETLWRGSPSWRETCTKVFGILHASTDPETNIDLLLSRLTRTIVLPLLDNASMAYFLLRQESIGTFRSAGLAIAPDFEPNCYRCLGVPAPGVREQMSNSADQIGSDRPTLLGQAVRHLLLPRQRGRTVDISQNGSARRLLRGDNSADPPRMLDSNAEEFRELEVDALLGVPYISGVASMPLGVLWVCWRRGRVPEFISGRTEEGAIQEVRGRGLFAMLDAISMIHSCHAMSEPQ